MSPFECSACLADFFLLLKTGRRARHTQQTVPALIQTICARHASKRNSMYRIVGADGREYGPISADQLRQWVAEGRANAQTRVLAEGTTEWKTVGELPEFASPGAAGPSGPASPTAPP